MPPRKARLAVAAWPADGKQQQQQQQQNNGDTPSADFAATGCDGCTQAACTWAPEAMPPRKAHLAVAA
jgi:hypothetical protein